MLMALDEERFFAEKFPLMSLDDACVVAGCFYAWPETGHVAVKVEFAGTGVPGEYQGLRVSAISSTAGVLDSVLLEFARYSTFQWDVGPGYTGYGMMYADPVLPPTGSPDWVNGDFRAMYAALAKYVKVWFNADLNGLSD